jgi:hypothetical protein
MILSSSQPRIDPDGEYPGTCSKTRFTIFYFAPLQIQGQ